MSYYSRFYPFIRPYLPKMLLAAGLVAGVALLNLALIRLAGVLWDQITVQRNLQGMTQTIGFFLSLVIGQGLLSVGHSYMTAWVSQHIMADFRTHVFAHLQRLSLNFFAKRRTGEILSRVMNG
jgi:ATP-binding cassette, subfamily B, bacterial MsbA